jgi:hypothetical protein
MNFKNDSNLIEDVWSLFLVFTSNFSTRVRSKFSEVGRQWGLLLDSEANSVQSHGFSSHQSNFEW